jgi:hypothetical protein
MGTEHVCKYCGDTFHCEEDGCATPAGAAVCAKCNRWYFGHHNDVFNRSKRDPAYAALIERIMARQRGERSCIGSLQIRQPETCA